MNDYMEALCQRFTEEKLYAEECQISEDSRLALLAQLSKPQRKLLQKLVDAESLLREKMTLDYFIAGFRLATGIARELSLEPPYSFDQEQEQSRYEEVHHV